MTTQAALKRPHLTMPEAEAAYLRAAYAGSSVILEYGSGGSTVMAGEMAGKTVTAVESDEAWAGMMQGWFAANPPVEGSTVDIHWANIGPTKDWGYPINNGQCREFPRYALDVWARDGFQEPDLVFIDGRFRVACFMATAVHITRPVEVLIDDYIDRPNYHLVEDWAGTPEMIGRMAAFTVNPVALTPQNLGAIARHLVIPG